jgi:hypothetical protein
MIDTPNTISILQYNVMKSKDQVMISFMADARTATYDIIAI